MNNTDIIKTDCNPPPSCCYFAVRRKEAHGWWCCRSLTLLHSLWVSDWTSAAPLSTYLPFICLVPRASRLRWAQRLNCPNSKGSAETRIRRQTQTNKLKDGCVFVQVCAYVCLWCNYDCQNRAYWAPWSHINREIIQFHIAMLGGIKTETQRIRWEVKAALGRTIVTWCYCGVLEWIYMTGWCERGEVWLDDSTSIICTELLHCNGLYHTHFHTLSI